ncbi:MAG: hypothetical protein HY507_00525 [Candidatus Zambryskibacteria bacterium]|nr:hypothetical protein [Candidatus Zambryskibacteria bacterium]
MDKLEMPPYVLDYDFLEEVLALIGPAIKVLMQRFGEGQGVLYITVVLESDGIEFDYEIGDLPSKDWQYPYGDLAENKARVALREKMDMADILKEPWRFRIGDTVYDGSVYEAGIAVGVSGCDEDTDTLIARFFLNTILMMSRRKFSKERKNIGNFIE